MASYATKKSVRKYQGSSIERSIERIRKTAEVFTPDSLLDSMTGMLDREEFCNPCRTFLDNSCGNGNILLYILKKKLANGISPMAAICSLYGVELMDDNVKECRQRLLDCVLSHSNCDEKTLNAIKFILNTNIVCHDALTWDYGKWCPKGQTGPMENSTGVCFIDARDTDGVVYQYWLGDNISVNMIKSIAPEVYDKLNKNINNSK